MNKITYNNIDEHVKRILQINNPAFIAYEYREYEEDIMKILDDCEFIRTFTQCSCAQKLKSMFRNRLFSKDFNSLLNTQ